MLNPAAGYHCLHVEEPLTHTLHMDDLKLFTRDDDALEDIMKVVTSDRNELGVTEVWDSVHEQGQEKI